MAFHGSLSNSKSPQVSSILLSIQVDLNDAVFLMVSTHPVIYKSSSLSYNLLVTVPSVPITVGITVTFMFHSFFSSLVKKKVNLANVVEGNQKASFSIATTLRCRGGRYSFPWIASFYPPYAPVIAVC